MKVERESLLWSGQRGHEWEGERENKNWKRRICICEKKRVRRKERERERGTSFVHGVVCKVIIMVKGINYK